MFNLFGQRTPISHAEAGTDPSLGMGSLNRPRLSSGLMVAGVVIGLIMLGGQVLSSTRRAAQAEIPTATIPPIVATDTPVVLATWTALPTYTLYPTFTPIFLTTPTFSPPTPTPDLSENEGDSKSVLATWTPGAWMLTKYAGGGK